MATYTVHKSYIDVIGIIWLPPIQCAMRYDIGEYEVGNLQTIDREGVEIWLSSHSGDFQDVQDFSASIWNHFDKVDVEIPWADPESEYTFNDLMYGSED